jgi:hypothetical protein
VAESCPVRGRNPVVGMCVGLSRREGGESFEL